MSNNTQNIELIGLQTDGYFHVKLNGKDYPLSLSRIIYLYQLCLDVSK